MSLDSRKEQNHADEIFSKRDNLIMLHQLRRLFYIDWWLGTFDFVGEGAVVF